MFTNTKLYFFFFNGNRIIKMKPRVWERVYVIVFKWWIMQVLGSLEQCSACYMWIHNLDQVEHVLYFFSRVPKDKVTTQGALQYYLLFFSNISTYIITRNCCILQYILHIYVWCLSNTKQSVFLWSTSKLRFKKMLLNPFTDTVFKSGRIWFIYQRINKHFTWSMSSGTRSSSSSSSSCQLCV